MERVEVIFFPSPLRGHFPAMLEMARLMIDRFDRLSISILLVDLPIDIGSPLLSESLPPSDENLGRLRFHRLPRLVPNPNWSSRTVGGLVDIIVEEHKPHMKEFISRVMTRPTGDSPPTRLGGIVVDMFFTSMIDVGNELGVRTYVFFASNAAFFGLMLHFQTLHDEHGHDTSKLRDSNAELAVPSFANSVPSSVLPHVLVDKHSWSTRFHRHAKKYREARGVIINTFYALERHALSFYDPKAPLIYPVGPLLEGVNTFEEERNIKHWLDCQPESSVLFLCFGSKGGFNREQVREIAIALEHSQCRYLWSLRKPAVDRMKAFPVDYKDLDEVLPEGFLSRNADQGKIIGWAPQPAVLSHAAIGGFVSHCGWNSILESLWFGVPIATWPLYAEQQLNAFQLVRELGLGVEISLDYEEINCNCTLVTADEIERGIRKVMERESEVRRRMKEMSEKSRMAIEEGGSSYQSLERLAYDLMKCSSN